MSQKMQLHFDVFSLIFCCIVSIRLSILGIWFLFLYNDLFKKFESFASLIVLCPITVMTIGKMKFLSEQQFYSRYVFHLIIAFAFNNSESNANLNLSLSTVTTIGDMFYLMRVRSVGQVYLTILAILSLHFTVVLTRKINLIRTLGNVLDLVIP